MPYIQEKVSPGMLTFWQAAQFPPGLTHICDMAGFPTLVEQLFKSVQVLACWENSQLLQEVHCQLGVHIFAVEEQSGYGFKATSVFIEIHLLLEQE